MGRALRAEARSCSPHQVPGAESIDSTREWNCLPLADQEENGRDAPLQRSSDIDEDRSRKRGWAARVRNTGADVSGRLDEVMEVLSGRPEPGWQERIGSVGPEAGEEMVSGVNPSRTLE